MFLVLGILLVIGVLKFHMWIKESPKEVLMCNIVFFTLIFQDIQNTLTQGRKKNQQKGQEIQKENPIHEKEEGVQKSQNVS